jgi:hypothetical protein
VATVTDAPRAVPTVAALVGLTPATGLVAWIAVTAWIVGPLAAGHGGDGRSWTLWLSAVLLVAAAAVVLITAGYPISARWTWIAASVAAVAALVPLVDGPAAPGDYAPWHLRSAVVVLAVLLLRGRPAAAWLGAAACAMVVLAWSAVTREDTAAWVAILLRQLILLVIAQALAMGLTRTVRAISSYRDAEEERIRAEVLRSEAARRRGLEVSAIRSLVGPLLHSVAAGGADDAARRDEARILESDLRDLLRGRRLAEPHLLAAARVARARGVDVVLLDDLGDSSVDDGALAAALDWAASRVEVAAGSPVTVRLSRHDGGARVTLVCGDDLDVRDI